MGDWLLAESHTIYYSVPTFFRRFCESLTPVTRFPSIRMVKIEGEAVA